MEITKFHKNLSEAEIKKANDYVESKIESINGLLTKFADDAKLLQVSIEKFEKHDAFEAEFRLTLPTKVLIAKEASHQITKAIDLAKDRLLSQIKKHVAHLRKDRAHASIRDNELAEVELPVEEAV